MIAGAGGDSPPRPIVLVVGEGRPSAASPSASGSARCGVRTPAPDARVRQAVADGSFFEHPVLFATMESGFHAGGRLHVFASVSEGPDGPGSATVELARRHTVPQVFVHLVVGDGSPTPVDPGDVGAYADRIAVAHPGARIATVEGRDWVRGVVTGDVRKAYDAIVHGVGRRAPTVAAALRADQLTAGPADRVMPAVVISTDGRIRDGDVVVDALPGRMGEGLVDALASGDEWPGFDRGAAPRDLDVVVVSGARRPARVGIAYAPAAEEVPWSAVASAGRRSQRIAWDYRLGRLAVEDTGAPEPAGGDWWDDEPAASRTDPAAGTGDEAVLAELRRAVDAGERDAFLAVLASPVDAAGVRALLSRVTGDATTDEPVGAAPRLPAVVAVLSTGMDGAELEIVAPRGVMLRDGDLDDVAPTLAELAGWPSPGGAGTSLVAR